MNQLNLFQSVVNAYANFGDGNVTNKSLYQSVVNQLGLSAVALDEKVKVGKSGQEHNLLKRQMRWHQQTLKGMGLIQKVKDSRGIWQLTEDGKSKLTRIKPDVAMVGYSTELGIAIWGNCRNVLSELNEPIMLCITSPPYPLRKPRAYGNPNANDYIDFICESLEPIVKNLHRAGSICLNISNDIFDEGLPSRSLYRERLVIALYERFHLRKMDEFVWYNKSKPPGPIEWASKTRQQLNVGWEPIYWFAIDPKACKADNRRVLEAHSEQHLKLVRGGGEKRERSNGDGAYIVKAGSYSAETVGRIPKNVFQVSHSSGDNRKFNKTLEAAGLPKHGAMMPAELVLKLILFLTDVGDLVIDPFYGSGTTGLQAEQSNRRWLGVECMLEHIQGSALRFGDISGLELNPMLLH